MKLTIRLFSLMVCISFTFAIFFTVEANFSFTFEFTTLSCSSSRGAIFFSALTARIPTNYLFHGFYLCKQFFILVREFFVAVCAVHNAFAVFAFADVLPDFLGYKWHERVKHLH